MGHGVTDSQTEKMLADMNASGGPAMHELSIEDARQALSAISLDCGYGNSQVFAHENRSISGPNGPVGVCIYWPGPINQKVPAPVIVFYHGGGFVLGDIETHDSIARYLSEKSNAIIVSVDYGLAPENKFPKGLEDCYAALEWVSSNVRSLGGDASRIAVAGDSAGGNLAAATCLLARDRDGPEITLQLLIYPCVDMTLEHPYPSYEKYGKGDYFLGIDDMKWINGLYFENNAETSSHYASPIKADLANLPPAVIITAECDPLCDQGEHYGELLRGAGNVAEYYCFEGTIHGFFNFAGVLDIGVAGMDRAVTAIKKYMA